MDELGVSDTISYKVVDQILSHVYPDESMSDEDFLRIYRGYMSCGGSWKGLIQGDPKCFELISKCLKSFIKIRNNPKKYGIK